MANKNNVNGTETSLRYGWSLGGKVLAVVLSVVLLGFSWPTVQLFDSGQALAENKSELFDQQGESLEETTPATQAATESGAAATATAQNAATADTAATEGAQGASDGGNQQGSQESQPAAIASTTDTTSNASVRIDITFNNASIIYNGQTLSAPSTGISVPSNTNFEFAVVASNGYSLKEVQVSVQGETHTISTTGNNASGNPLYKVNSADVARGASITLVTEVAGASTNEPAADATPIEKEDTINTDTSGNSSASDSEATDTADENAGSDDEAADEPAADANDEATADDEANDNANDNAVDEDSNSGIFDGIVEWWNSLTGGSGDTSVASISGEDTVEVGDSITLTGAKSSNYHLWKTSDENVAKVSSNNSNTATVTGNGKGTATITHKYGQGDRCYNKQYGECSEDHIAINKRGWGSSWTEYYHYNYSESYTITVTAAVEATELTLPETATVERGSTLDLKAQATYAPSNAKITWSSSDSAIATVGAGGIVKGVKPGKVTITAQSGDLIATTEVTVTAKQNSNKDDRENNVEFYYMKNPTADPYSNDTGEWGSQLGGSSAFGKIDLTGATWDSNNKNTYDNVPGRVVSWPDGSTGTTYSVQKGSTAWNEIFSAWQKSVSADLGVDITEDDVESITLTPFKISNNSRYHVDCKVDVNCKSVVTAKYMLQDAGSSEFLQSGVGQKFIANKGTTSPSGTYPETKTYNGHTYTFSGWYDNEACTGTPVAFPYSVGDHNLTFYAKYVRSDIQYTVNYYWNGTSDKVAESVTKAAGTPGTVVSETPATIDGYTAVSNAKKQIVVKEDGTNEINFYYYKNVELTANSDTVTYDGTEHSISGYTVKGADDTTTFDGIADPVAKGTNAGTYDAKFQATDTGKVSTDGKYIVSKTNDGKLTISPVADEVVVTITGKTETATYDGTQKSASGYEVSINNNKYTESDFSFSGDATAKGTNAGSYNMGLAEGQFANTNGNFTNVKFVVTDGSLTINKRDVTLTSASGEKVYDGVALTKNAATDITVGGDGFVAGQGASYSITGSQTEVGESANEFTYTLNEGTSADNYNITKTEGTLKVTQNEQEIVVVITENSDTVKYSGSEQKVEGYAVTSISSSLYTDKDFSFSGDATAKGTNAGSYDMQLKASDFINNNANFKNVTFQIVDGSLTIQKRDVTLTSGSAEKVYDGAPLTKDEVAVSGDGFVEGEGATYDVTGAITNVGTADNAFDYALKDGTGADNYNITKAEGILKVTPIADEVVVTITGNTGTQKYDGTEKTVSGYTVSINNDKYTQNDFEFSGSSEIKQTNAGTYSMGLAETQFANKSSNFTNVKFVVTDGSLTIQKRDVALTSGSKSKTYDGSALTDDTVTVSGDGFVGEEGATYDVTGTITNVGTTENAFDYTLKDGTSADNYNITTKNGTLEVTANAQEVVVTIAGNTDTQKYSSSEQKVEGYTVTSISSSLYTDKDFSFSGDATAKGTNAGTYDMGLAEGQFANTNGNFTNVKFVVTDGSLTIQKRDVTLTSGSAEKVYDGAPLTKDEVAVSGDGFVEGEGATYDVTGTITNAGEAENAFTYDLKEGTSADNYNITKETGKLTVNPVTNEVTIKIAGKTAEKEYNGSEQSVEGYDVTDTGSSLIAASDIINSDDAIAQGTEVGEYPMGLTQDQFALSETMAKNFTNVTFDVTDGMLTITKADIKDFVTLAGTDVIKTYDGNTYAAGAASATDKYGHEVKIEYSIDGQTWTTDPSTITATNVSDSKTIRIRASVEDTYNGYVETTQSLTINPRTVTLTSETASKVYDGTPLTKPTVKVEGDGFVAGEVSDVAATGSVTNVSEGKVANTIVYTEGASFKAENYTITKNEGELSITAIASEVVVTIKGNTDTQKYSGSEQSVTGYTVKNISNSLYTANDFSHSGSATAKGIDANTYNMGLAEGQFANTNGNFTNVKFVVTDGSLTINPRTVTLTSATDSKVYDGKALTNSTVTEDGDGFVEGEGATYTVTGTITNVGEAENAFTYALKDGTKAGNYTIAQTAGKLTVTPVTDKVIVTITEHSDTATYDGTEHSVTGYDASSNNTLYTEGDFSFTGTAEAKGTNAGTYNMELKPADFRNVSNNFTNVEFQIVDGALVINPVDIADETAITVSQPDNVVYNGQDQKQKPVVTDKSGNVLVEGTDYELSYTPDVKNAGQVTVTVTGKGNYSGSVDRSYSITRRTVYVDTNTASKPYDGEELVGVATPRTATQDTGFVAGEGATFTATTIGPDVTAQTTNGITNTEWNEGTSSANYNVVDGTIGTLEITSAKESVTVDSPENKIYNGSDQTWTPTVKNGEATLVADRDYTVEYSTTDRTNVTGQITVTIKGAGNYAGFESVKTYQITARDVYVSTNTSSKVYDGSVLEGAATVAEPTETTGFVAGEGATFTATTIGPDVTPSTQNAFTTEWDQGTTGSNYNVVTTELGTLEITSQSIVPGDDDYTGVQVGNLDDVVYNGQSQAQKPTVTDKNGNALTEDTEYTIAFSADTINAGQVKVTVTGKGNYSGSVERYYNITPRTVTVNTNTDSKAYDGSVLEGAATVAEPTDTTGFVAGEGATFTATTIGPDVTAQTTNGITKTEWNEGTRAANYTVVNGTIGTLEITSQSIADDAKIAINDPSDSVYDGQVHQWAPTVTTADGKTTLVAGTDYEVKYSTNNFTDVTGAITVTITGKGNYSGSVEKTYQITPRPVTVKSADLSKKYDGSALTNGTRALDTTEGSWVTGEGITPTFTGSQTLVGTSDNAYTYVANNGTKLSNYTIAKLVGSLTVTDGTGDDPVDPSGVVTKTHVPGTYGLGDTVTFTITAKNIYDTTKTMTFSEIEGVTLEQSVFTDVAAGETVTTKATYTIAEADILAQSFTNTATVSYSDGKSFEGTDTVPASEIADKNAHLTVVKTTTNNEDKTKIFQVGEDIEYKVVVTNDGNVTISNVAINDQLEGVVLTSDTGETTLAPGATRTATYRYTVTQADVDAGKSIVNNATATGTDPDDNEPEVVPGETDDAIPAQNASATGNKRAKKEDGSWATGLTTGDTAYWTVTLTNNGNVTLNNIYFNEKMNVDVISATDGDGNSVAFTNADAKNTRFTSYKRTATLDPSFTLAPGECVVVQYAAYTITESDVNAGAVRNIVNAGGHYTNAQGKDKTAGVNLAGNIYTRGNATFTIAKVETDQNGEALSEAKTYGLGDTIYYKLQVENNGNFDLTDLVITDANAGITSENAFTKDALARGESWAIDTVLEHKVTEADIIAGKVENVANGTAKSGSKKTPNPTAESNTVVTPTEAANPSLDVTKTTTSAMPEGGYKAGDTISYKITVTNNGNLTVNNITVTDELTGNGANNPLATGVTLEPGKSAEYTASYTVTEADTVKGTTITNTAVATGKASDGSETTDTGTKTDDNVKGVKSIDVVKKVTSTAKDTTKGYQLDEDIAYSITVTNNGNTTLKDVTVKDSLTGETWTVEGEFAPGATKTFNTSHKVTQADIIAKAVENTATATGTVVADGAKVSDSDTAKVGDGGDGKIVDKNSHLTVTKETTSTAKAEDGKYALGETITYKVTVTNDGNMTINNVAINDQLKGVVLVSDTGETMLAPGATRTATCSYTVTQADVLKGNVVNNATATGTDPEGKDPTVVPDDTEDKTESPNGHMTVEKKVTNKSDATGADGKWAAGDIIEYLITVTNDGNLDLTNVTIVDELEGIELTSDSWTIGDLAQGASATVTAKYKVTEADTIAGFVKNDATAKGTSPDPDNPNPGVTPGSSTEDTEQAKAHITMAKETTSTAKADDGKYALGETITYKVTATNDGNLTLTNVAINDQLEGVVLVSDTGETTLAPGAVRTATYSYVVTEADVAKGNVVNNVTASADSPDPGITPDVTPDGTDDSTEPENAHLTVDKTTTSTAEAADGKYALGETITYQVVVTNDGNQTISNVAIDDQLEGVVLTSDTGETTLAPGAKRTATYSYVVTQADVLAGTVVNTATASGTTPDGEDPGVTPDTDPEPTDTPNGHMTVVKTVTNPGDASGANGHWMAGDTIQYQIVVTNDGNLDLTNVVVTDRLDGVTLTSGSWNVGSLPQGESATITATYTVTAADAAAGSVVNVATATGTSPDPDNPNPGVTPGTDEQTVDPTPVTPVPPTPVTPTVTPTGPIAPVVNALEDAITPLVNLVEPETIADDETPLANADPYCWVHYYIIIGIIITAVYGVGVVTRRNLFGRKIKGFEDDTLGKSGNKQSDANEVSIPKGAQPAMATAKEA